MSGLHPRHGNRRNLPRYDRLFLQRLNTLMNIDASQRCQSVCPSLMQIILGEQR